MAGDAGCDGRAMVAAHHVQAQVQARGDTGAGEDVALVQVQHLGIDPHRREAVGELRGGIPMGGGAAAVGQAGIGQREGTGADRY
jgi:hypothetical protein